MKLKIILVLFLLFKFVWNQWLTYLTWKQREKPLPDVVSNIYSKERYKSYIDYKKEYRKISLGLDIISLVIGSVFILSNFYTLFDISLKIY